MEVNWIYLGIGAFCAMILIIYLIRKNLKDKKEVTKYFNEEFKQKKDIEFSVVLIPGKEQISEEDFDKFKNQYGVSKINYDRFLPQKRLIADVFKPAGIKVIDLMDYLNGKDSNTYYFPVDAHLNKKGNRFVAEIIASKIIDERK